MEIYRHKVQYYETDRMGITHHSNYIRWMEEARIDFLDQIGWNYREIEEMGIISPVISVDTQYKNTTTFYDEIEIKVTVEKFNGIKLVLAYEMTRLADELVVCTGHSEHCFLDKEGNIVRMKRNYPELYQVMCQHVEEK